MTGTDDAIAAQREQLAAWLARRDVTGISFTETHVSTLAFDGERVWKCKKPVRFAFADFTTLEQRAENCRRELALNRRLAPDVYLGVEAVGDDSGTVVDVVVEMRRLPDDRRLASLAARGDDAGACIERVASQLADFHRKAATGGAIDDAATSTAIAGLWAANLEELRPFVGAILDPVVDEAIARDSADYVSGREPLFEARRAAGHIRDGHGDLLADDVFCLPDGPRVLDCLEFDDRLRYGDVLADLAFLAMDLEHLGRADLATTLLDRYRQLSGDAWPRSLEHHYIAYRALVRAKVACLRASADPDAAPRARALFELCTRHLAAGRVRLVLIGGAPATGKTTLADALGRRAGWRVLHSDETRKRLAGLGPAARAVAPIDTGLYDNAWTDRTYNTLLERARERLVRGDSVIIDASWGSVARREAAVRVAEETRSACVHVRCEVPPNIAATRATTRAAAGGDASDATAGIARALTARFEPWPDAIVIDTEAPIDRLTAQLTRALDLR